MKLRTVLREDGYQSRTVVDYTDGREVDHDAMAAHALLQAMLLEAPGVHARVIERAAEILAGWLGEEGR